LAQERIRKENDEELARSKKAKVEEEEEDEELEDDGALEKLVKSPQQQHSIVRLRAYTSYFQYQAKRFLPAFLKF